MANFDLRQHLIESLFLSPVLLKKIASLIFLIYFKRIENPVDLGSIPVDPGRTSSDGEVNVCPGLIQKLGPIQIFKRRCRYEW